MAIDVVNPIGTFRVLPIGPNWPFIYGATAAKGSWGGTTPLTASSCILLGGYKSGGLGSTAPPFVKNIAGGTSPTCYALGQSEDLLAAQTISGNVTFTLMAQESNVGANNFLRVYLWVKQAGTANGVRGVLLDWTDGNEFPTSAIGITSGPIPLTPVVAQEGDLLMIEIGTVNAVFAGFNGKIWFSGGCLSTGVFVNDMTAGSVTATEGTTVVFDTPVLVHQPVPEAGDVLAGNTRLFLYDGVTGELKREVIPPGNGAVSGGQTQADGTIIFGADTGFQYVPSWLWRFNADLSFAEYFDAGAGAINPHSLARDASGNNYVGYVGNDGTGCGERGDVGPPTAPSYYVRRSSPLAVIDATYAIAQDLGGSQAIDLAADQSTLFYTSLGRKVKRYDVVADSQLTDFATLPVETAAVARGMVILPDGGVIVADMVNLKRLDAAGTLVQTYTLPASVPPIYIAGLTGTLPVYANYYTAFTTTFSSRGDWGVVALSPDGTELWAANRSDFNTGLYGSLGKWNIETGELLILITQGFILSTGGGFCSGGLAIYNGFRAGIPTSPVASSIALNCPSSTFTVTGYGFDEDTVLTVTRDGIEVPATVLTLTATVITFTLETVNLGTEAEYCASVSNGESEPSEVCGDFSCEVGCAAVLDYPPEPPVPHDCPVVIDADLIFATLTTNGGDDIVTSDGLTIIVLVPEP